MELPEAVRRHLDAPRNVDASRPTHQARFVVFDTEMTGLGKDDRLLSLGAVRVEAGRLVLGDSFYRIVDPECGISTESIKVHEIVPDVAAGCPGSAEMLPAFLDFAGGDVLVAHNARFDRDFIDRELRRHFGLPLQSMIVDVWLLSRANSFLREKYRIPGAVDDHSLDGLARTYGLNMEERHTAYGDALVTGLIFLWLMKALQRFRIWKVKHLLKAGGI
jgi:DNA polymerase-3 subunit epsilon